MEMALGPTRERDGRGDRTGGNSMRERREKRLLDVKLDSRLSA